jgi:cyanophycin synthetase
VQGFGIEDIKVSLETFIPSPAQTPGRLNMFNFQHFDLLLDYAHNPPGLRALQKMIERMDGHPKVGIIAGVGDRRVEDNNNIGRIAAEMFDEIIVRQDKNLRGKSEEELIAMLVNGIKEVDPLKKITIIPSENEAIRFAVQNATKGSLIVLCSDVVPEALDLVMELKAAEANKLYEFKKEDIPNL